ncbi:MAG: hypothetical protein OEW04_02060 [Nitrospirota bacterium]|nr:hypothetical protein [Nitrospirota bacterium]
MSCNRLKGKKLIICYAIFTAVVLINSPSPLSATVTGVCSNCHTMHNSQNGSQVARSGTGVGWDGSSVLTGGSLSGPLNQLLVTNCVGCHTSTTNFTIINFGGSKIPIVFNTEGYPSDALAGGNFYWVSQRTVDLKYNAYGHNVYGIAGSDTLTQAPGKLPGCGTSGSCHMTLAAAPSTSGLWNNYNRGGCQGCHVYTSHHKDRGWYRFLKGHDGLNKDFSSGDDSDYVIGKGDTDWEKTKSSADHNWYKGTNTQYVSNGSALKTYQTITSFCAGCHSRFHNTLDIARGGGPNYASPWLRHPTDILLYNKGGEYTAYDTVNAYSTEAPVAWTNPDSPSKETAVVMCLSCHRPHGSDQPDMLRWDYATMIVGDDTKSGGCFTCHTSKNDAL